MDIQDGNDFFETADFFKNLGLPVPQQGEFYPINRNTQDPKKLVFLNEFGLVIRITPLEKIFKGSNPHFIKPLFSRSVGNYQIDIDPGIDCPVPDDQAHKIANMFRWKHNIYVNDVHEFNFGYLPGVKPAFPIIIDLDPTTIVVGYEVTKKLNTAVSKIKNMLGIETPAPIDTQAEFYRPLKQIIDEAWPVENPDADKDGIRKFFEACKDYKRSGKLLSAWQTNPYFSTASCAENYNARLMPLSI